MRKVVLLSLILQSTIVFSQTILPVAFSLDGPVYTTAIKGDTMYVGGSFSNVYTKESTSNYGAVVNKTSGELSRLLPKPNDVVNAVIDDGNGGWYIGGSFTKVGDSTRLGVAQINSEGVVTDWNPGVEQGEVSVLLKHGDIIYVGGNYRYIGGKSKYGLARVDATMGVTLDWDIAPADWSVIYTMAIADSVLYIGGSFSKINGENRGNLAAIDLVESKLTSWNPMAGGGVVTLAIHNDKVYVGGGFSSISGLIRQRLAEIDLASGTVTAWRVDVVGSVSTISIRDSILYVGGSFTKLGGVTRNGFGAFNIKNESVTSFDLGLPLWENVNTSVIVGNTLYIGGRFTKVGGKKRAGSAAIDLESEQMLDWNPAVDMVDEKSNVHALAVSTNGIYMGGAYPHIGGMRRNNLAAMSASDFKLFDWNPNANDTVYTIQIADSAVYAGGAFTQIGNQNHNKIVSINAVAGLASDWNPDVSGTVHAIAVYNDTVYIGGVFSAVGGRPYNNIAAIERSSGNAIAWNPNANGKVKALAKKGDKIYAGGEFTIMGGLPRNYLASLDLDGNTTSWNPYGGAQLLNAPDGNSPKAVNVIIVEDSIVYVFGNFFIRLGSADRKAALAANINGVLANWQILSSGGAIQTAIATDNEFYIGGDFLTVNSDQNSYVGVVKKSTGEVTTPFYSSRFVPSPVHSLCLSNKMLHTASDGRITYIPLGNTLICDEDTLRFSYKPFTRHVFVLNNTTSWKANTLDQWITLAPDSGAGIWETDLGIAVKNNEAEQERIAVVSITSGTTTKNIVVIQEAHAPVGVAETSILNEVEMYPNPSAGMLTLANNTGEKIDYLIMNLNGQIVKSLTSITAKTSTQFNLELAAGMYVVRLLCADASKTLKLVVTE